MTNTLYSPAPGESPALPPQTGPAAAGPVGAERVADLVGQLLAALGEDPGREGLAHASPGRRMVAHLPLPGAVGRTDVLHREPPERPVGRGRRHECLVAL
jgi:hypothetical protein